MEAWWRAPDPGQAKVREDTLSMLQKMLRDFEAKGQKMEAQGARDALKEIGEALPPPDPKQKKPFVYPPRAKRIEPLLVLPKGQHNRVPARRRTQVIRGKSSGQIRPPLQSADVERYWTV